MPPQSQDQPGPDPGRAGRAERRSSGRAQRKIAEEQAVRRKQLTLLGGAIAAAVIVALVLILVNRPQDAGAPVLVAEAMPPEIPVDGMAMGAADAPVTVVEWGDYT
ncbi:MAG: hypothetical protein M3Q50_02845 [Chloroflexota bacterium]|nr:hypothetical protein [Chloroflexia bacterium]MDQ3225558.1 hypothetical protein [Chloroflexota bacterium]